MIYSPIPLYFSLKLWEFEVVRAAAMIFVVLSRFLIRLGGDEGFLRAIAGTVVDIGISLFFFAPGYLYYANNCVVKSAPASYGHGPG
jgi:hypothetical protein